MKQSCNLSHPSNNEKDFIVHCSLFIVHFFRMKQSCYFNHTQAIMKIYPLIINH